VTAQLWVEALALDLAGRWALSDREVGFEAQYSWVGGLLRWGKRWDGVCRESIFLVGRRRSCAGEVDLACGVAINGLYLEEGALNGQIASLAR
jgi:hypothetical protein